MKSRVFMLNRLSFLFLSTFFLFSCEKDLNVLPDNNAPYYDGVSDVLIRNYVNRIFIDYLALVTPFIGYSE